MSGSRDYLCPYMALGGTDSLTHELTLALTGFLTHGLTHTHSQITLGASNYIAFNTTPAVEFFVVYPYADATLSVVLC